MSGRLQFPGHRVYQAIADVDVVLTEAEQEQLRQKMRLQLLLRANADLSPGTWFAILFREEEPAGSRRTMYLHLVEGTDAIYRPEANGG